MNQRLKRKAKKRRRQQICEALDLCLQINGLQKSKRRLTGDHPTAFFEFNGRAAGVGVRVFRYGWESYVGIGERLLSRITRSDELGEMIGQLKQLKKDLHSGNCDGSKTNTIHPYYKGE